MGQRAARETFLAVLTAFIDRSSWAQASLARHVGVGVPALRKHLLEMKAAGWPLEQYDDPPQVYWSVPKGWYPGALIFKPEEVADLLRLVALSPRGPMRTRLLRLMLERLPVKEPAASYDPSVARAADMTADEERSLEIVYEAAAKKAALHMRYFTASRGDEAWRHVSVHRVDAGPPARFVATCHRSNGLRWFRISSVSAARLDPAERFRPTTEEKLARFEAESLDGFHDEGPPVHCAFFVRQPEAIWARRNLIAGMKHETVPGGIRVSCDTTAVSVAARFVVGLGEAARSETPELAAAVVRLAKGALASSAAQQASTALDNSPRN